MPIDRDTLIFLDASCLIAAIGSPKGGSAFLLALCNNGFLRTVVSEAVLIETERNVADSFGGAALSRYDRLIAMSRLEVMPVPSASYLQRMEQLVGSKDAHVLAAAHTVEAPYIISLDKKLVERINASGLSMVALSPGDFIRSILPTHPDYSSFR
jgi:predicted nucleic acid-binding protein